MEKHILNLPDYQIKITVSKEPYECKGGRYNYEYLTTWKGKTLFRGTDFSPSPMDEGKPLEMLTSCLSFHCLRPGDTDSEFFAKYTKRQLEWASSFSCEDLQGRISDLDSTEGFYAEDEKHYFNSNIK